MRRIEDFDAVVAALQRAPLAARLEQLAAGGAEAEALLPWLPLLDARDVARLQGELAMVLAEPEETGEPLDCPELAAILEEYAELAGWSGPLLAPPEESPDPGERRYRVEVRTRELRALEAASPAVRTVAGELLAGFLTLHPTAGERLPRGHLKKLSERDIWQLELPDGYRLRYLVDEHDATVHVVYLGPHPEGTAEGRERAVRALLHRRRHEGAA